MLRYKTKRPGFVALCDIRPGNGAGLFLQLRSPHGAMKTASTFKFMHDVYESVLFDQNCSSALLSECITLGVKCTLRKYREQSSVPHSPVTPTHLPSGIRGIEPATLDPLLRAAELTLYRRINSIINMLPVPHRVCMYVCVCVGVCVCVFVHNKN